MEWATTIRTSAGMEAAARLRRIYEAVRDVIERHQPSALAIERQGAFEVRKATGMFVARAPLQSRS